MKNVSVTHIYGVGGLIPGVLSLIIAWKVDSPWSEYLLMASGWFAAAVYAVLLLRISSIGTVFAERCGKAETQYEKLQESIHVLQERHNEEMQRRATTLDYLAGIAMTQQATPRRRTPRENSDDN
ncbi:hypothetical protein QP575_10500 [Alcaligenes faecalis subsp. phenolicus]|uniref:hypothetical protein n=1 Tax=Alcaligenes nematophilus TaxID=2994643 RepID=UPI002AA3F2B6|nr:hypothetical protein [Alcaligenes phenolicus]